MPPYVTQTEKEPATQVPPELSHKAVDIAGNFRDGGGYRVDMRRLAVVLSLTAAGALAAVAVVFAGGRGSGPPTIPVDTPSFPAPLAGAVVFSRELGWDALALAVKPDHGGLLLQASILGKQGQGVAGRSVAFAAAGSRVQARPCGPGCYRGRLPRTTTVEVVVGTTRWRVPLPEAWPAHDATKLVARAERVWRSLDSLSFHEILASGPGEGTASTWRAQAPDRIAYEVEHGWSAVIVGGKRWDRAPGSRTWRESPQLAIHQPVPGWVRVTDAHVLGTSTLAGHAVWRVSFFDPGTPGWFTLAIDKQTLHTLALGMITTAHFMHDRYGAFNSTPPIVAPR